MKIFDKRPLSLILCIMLGGFVFFSYSEPAFKIVIPLVAVAVFIISFFIFDKDKGKILLLRLSAGALLAATLFSYVYFDVYFPISKRYNDELEIVATVDDIDASTSPRAVTLITQTINSVEEDFKILTHLGYDELTNISVGSKIKFKANIKNTTSNNLYLKSQGISGEIDITSDIELLAVNNLNSPYDLSVYRDNLSKKLVLNSDSESGGLLAAILLGEKSYLSPQIALDFQRTGTSHILALSGMHLAILTFAIAKLLSLLKLNKKLRKIFEILFVIAYMALTGFSSSVVRAGIMLIVSSLLFLLSRKSDSITSLFITVALICIFDPCSVFDLSLWLSALATLGILTLAEMNDKQAETDSSSVPLYKRMIKNTLFAFIASVFAMSTTMLITAFSFQTISPLGLIITPLISPFISLFMNLGAIFLIVADFLPLGPIISILGELICDIMGFAASFRGIFTSANFPIVKILIFAFTVCVFAFFILEIKRKKATVLIMCGLLTASFAAAIINTALIKDETALDYSVSEGKEAIYLSSDSENAVIDTSVPTCFSVAPQLTDLKSRGLTEIDNYVFTNYSYNIHEAAEAVLSSIYVEKMYIPAPATSSEDEIYKSISQLSRIYRTEIIFYSTSDMIFIGDITYFPTYRSSEGDKIAFTLKYNDEFYSYVSPKMFETETKAVAFSIIEGCHTLILGSHGSTNITDFSYNLDGIDTLIISSSSFKVSDNVTDGENAPKTYVDPAHISLIR